MDHRHLISSTVLGLMGFAILFTTPNISLANRGYHGDRGMSGEMLGGCLTIVMGTGIIGTARPTILTILITTTIIITVIGTVIMGIIFPLMELVSNLMEVVSV